MRKLITTFLFTILLLTNAQLVFADDDAPSRRDLIRECKDTNQCSEKESFGERRDCRQACRAEASNQIEYSEAGEIGNQGEERRTILPPTEKPTSLPGPNLTGNTGNDAREYIINRFLPSVAKRLTTIVAVLSLLGLVYSGILFFTAAGVSDKFDKAKKAAIYSVVGLVIALMSFTIVQIINLLPLG